MYIKKKFLLPLDSLDFSRPAVFQSVIKTNTLLYANTDRLIMVSKHIPTLPLLLCTLNQILILVLTL